MGVRLFVTHGGAETDALRETLDMVCDSYDMVYSTTYAIELDPETGPNDDKTGVVRVEGYDAVFTLCSRWAHTLPGNPLHAGWTMQAVELARGPLEVIDTHLSEHSGKLCPELDGHTAADLVLYTRIKRSMDSSSEFPNLVEFMNEYELTEESDVEEEVAPRLASCSIM